MGCWGRQMEETVIKRLYISHDPSNAPLNAREIVKPIPIPSSGLTRPLLGGALIQSHVSAEVTVQSKPVRYPTTCMPTRAAENAGRAAGNDDRQVVLSTASWQRQRSWCRSRGGEVSDSLDAFSQFGDRAASHSVKELSFVRADYRCQIQM